MVRSLADRTFQPSLQLGDHVLDHLNHLREGVGLNLDREERKAITTKAERTCLENFRGALLLRRTRRGTQVNEGLLHQAWKVLFSAALHCAPGDDLDRLLDRLELLSPRLLPCFKSLRLQRTLGGEVCRIRLGL